MLAVLDVSFLPLQIYQTSVTLISCLSVHNASGLNIVVYLPRDAIHKLGIYHRTMSVSVCLSCCLKRLSIA